MLPRTRELLKIYTSDGSSDQKAVQNYVDCENDDTLRSLQNELSGIASGSFPEESLKGVLGPQRLTVHTSYPEWAKRMLMWIAAYRRQ